MAGNKGNFDIQGVTDKTKAYNEYGEQKINNIVELGVFQGTKELQNFNLGADSKPNYKDETFAIEHSTDISSEYDQRYESRYILRLDGEIEAVLYYRDKDTEDKKVDRVNYIERYDRPAYNNDKNYFQVVHNENEAHTRIFNREKADSEVPVSVLVAMKENNGTKEYKMTQIRSKQNLSSEHPDLGVFAAVENLSSDNLSAVFNYKAANLNADSNFYADKNTINNTIDAGYLDPSRGGQIEGLESGDYNFEPLDDFNADPNYPTKVEVENLYHGKDSNDFEMIYKLDFNLNNFEYQNNQTLIEMLGLN